MRRLAILVVGLIVAGCPRPVPTPWTGSIEAYLPDGVDLAYSFELERNPIRVFVRLALRGAPDGNTILSLSPSWSGLEQIGEEVRELAAIGEDGVRLEVRHPESYLWEVRHPPGQRILVRYQLLPLPGPLSLESQVRNYHRPLVDERRFHLIGNLGLLIPQHLWTAEPRHIDVRWKGFAEAGWTVASSHSAEQEGFRIYAIVEEFRHALFAAGPMRLSVRNVRGGQVVVAIHGLDWAFSDTELVDLAVRIVRVERDFFADHEYPYFLISLLPVGRKKKGLQAMSGMGLTNSFALFMAPGVRLREPESGRMVRHLLAHELFHNWNGGRIVVDQPEILHYWFSEGFTNHYTRKLLYRAGLVSLEETVEDLNETLARYTLSPARNAPNRRIAEAFWSQKDFHDLPYLRGDLVAMLVDGEIRRRSRGKKSLDDLMRHLHDQARESLQAFDNRELFAEIERFTDAAFTKRIRRIVVDGATAVPEPGTYAPCLRTKKERLGPFDLGFDFVSSRRHRRVSGVREGSRAHRAGLRDGQRLLGWDAVAGKIKRRVLLTVEERGQRRQVGYLPQGEPAVEVLQFVSGTSPKKCRVRL